MTRSAFGSPISELCVSPYASTERHEVGEPKIPMHQAREILEHLEEALTLLDISGQRMVAAHVQMGIDLFRETVEIDATTSDPEQHSR